METTVNLAGWLEKLIRMFLTYIYYKKIEYHSHLTVVH